MGYYSYHNIEIVENPEDKYDEDYVMYKLQEKSGYSDLYDHIKWYDYIEDCTWLTEQFPNLVLTVFREGEESGDLERIYFKNGKHVSYTPKILWPDENWEKDLQDAN